MQYFIVFLALALEMSCIGSQSFFLILNDAKGLSACRGRASFERIDSDLSFHRINF